MGIGCELVRAAQALMGASKRLLQVWEEGRREERDGSVYYLDSEAGVKSVC